MKCTHLTLYFSKSYLLDATAHLTIGKCSQSHTLWGLLFSCVLGNLEYVILGSYWAPLVEAHMTSWCWVFLLLLCQAWAQRCFTVLSVLLVFWPAHFPLFTAATILLPSIQRVCQLRLHGADTSATDRVSSVLIPGPQHFFQTSVNSLCPLTTRIYYFLKQKSGGVLFWK